MTALPGPAALTPAADPPGDVIAATVARQALDDDLYGDEPGSLPPPSQCRRHTRPEQ